ncbi:uncharacterized protein EAF02_007820 [Botrytis sinoallii]|uniref:uncharacterized protein n=1 Tax=Botrytis sinoallii TaxID=1463999 RepID=UPI0018FF7CE9|nr:uncharacterized protein EAF02_007820 [Botrytis sinoallii]KAF7879650.1 hypothetical protein EAF02_007820 [Botrytis sinoallii]
MLNLAKFHELSVEIQSLILKACEPRDLSRLSQASRGMYECTLPIMYRHINLSSHRTTSDDLIDLRGFVYTSSQHKDNVKRQNAFINTILRLPTLGKFVSSLTWTIYPRQCSYQQKCEDHAKILFYEDYLGPLAIITPAVFPEATVIRMGGIMPYNYFRACVSTPSIVASLEMENLQGLLQPRDGFRLSNHVLFHLHVGDHFWSNQTRYKETKDENGIPVLRHAGPMRGHLKPLIGKFVSQGLRWSETRERKRYSEMASFITSVAPTLVTFAFEQGVGLEPLEKRQVESHNHTFILS